MIEVTMEQLMQCVDVIQKLINAPIPLSAKISYQIIRIAREVEKEYNLFQDSRMNVIKQYAERDENGEPIIQDGMYSIPKEKEASFNTEYNDMMDSTIQINAEPLALSDTTMEELKLTPLEWMKIEPFVR